MASITDPALEFADMCNSLKGGGNTAGWSFLAKRFQVEPYSKEFFQILGVIQTRIADLEVIFSKLNMDESVRKDALAHLKNIRHAFAHEGLHNQWSHSETNYLSKENVQPIKMLSPVVRSEFPYPSLDTKEREQVIKEVEEFRSWLFEHQLAEQDFVRQILIDGLDQLIFRLKHIEWLGWGYTIQSLRDVLSAYIILDRGGPDRQTSPDAAEALRMTRDLIRSFYEKAKIVKEAYEVGEFAVGAYKTAITITKSIPGVAGLLSLIK